MRERGSEAPRDPDRRPEALRPRALRVRPSSSALRPDTWSPCPPPPAREAIEAPEHFKSIRRVVRRSPDMALIEGTALGAAAAALIASASAATVPHPIDGALPRGGSVVVDHDALVAYVADADNAALHRVDLVSLEVTSTA